MGDAVDSSRMRRQPRRLGRYVLYDAIASGGMASVHYARLLGPVGFARTVAIKRLHPHLAADPDFVTMFLDEAHLASRIAHPNVVPTLDVEALDGELFIVMEYVHGAALSRLWRLLRERGERIPVRITSAIMCNALHGLHAAHETVNDRGEPLDIIHRDVSPQNILVGADGIARIVDFGVAKATGRLHTTQEGNLKGKLAYMAPEQLRRQPFGRAVDIYAAAVVLWETLAGRRLFPGESEAETLEGILLGLVDPPSKYNAEVPAPVDEIVLRGLDGDPQKRFSTAREMALALETAIPPALPSEVGDWVLARAKDELRARAQVLAEVESASREDVAPPASDPAGTETAIDVEPTATRPDQPTPRRWRVLAGVGLGIAASIAGAAFFARTAPRPPEMQADAAPPPVVIEARPSASTAVEERLPAVVSAPAPVRVEPAIVSAPVRPAPAVAAPRRAPRPAPTGSCAPFTVDANGHVTFNRECK